MLAGLQEDSAYLIEVSSEVTAIFVDDVQLQPVSPSVFCWSPALYAGRVTFDAVLATGGTQRYFLDISPNPKKSGQDEFDGMVAEIREFDQSLLSGTSSATMAFGRAGRPGRYEWDILLSRLREHGPAFLDAIETITRSPHRFLAADKKVLPLSQVRRLHHSALQDRRLAAIAAGANVGIADLDTFQVNSLTSSPTFDTPANRALLALLRRFSAVVHSVADAVRSLKLGALREEQESRTPRRLLVLEAMQRRAQLLLTGPLFREVASAQTSSAGLTQIAAQPAYSRAYRLGSRALASQLDGDDSADNLHIPPSWGIYETWCYLTVVKAVSDVTGCPAVERPSRAVAADRSLTFDLSEGRFLEVLFQGVFPAQTASNGRLGWSISRERRPDIVLVLHSPNRVRTAVFDAKWRSKRANVLDAMESAHIYHDALRLGDIAPSPCVLLLPGQSDVPELEESEFVAAHGVGAISAVRIGAEGLLLLANLLSGWLATVHSS
ncbi:MAG: DUF2357 domain-containing protein [Rubrivivax sp.]|nr:DUF2357 domain-containing protein [Rubrivivax sp.]